MIALAITLGVVILFNLFLGYKLLKNPVIPNILSAQEVENIVKANIAKSCTSEVKPHTHNDLVNIIEETVSTVNDLSELISAQTDVLLDLEQHTHNSYEEDINILIETQNSIIKDVDKLKKINFL